MVSSTKVQVSNVWLFFDLPTEGVQDTSTRKLEAAQKRVAIFLVVVGHEDQIWSPKIWKRKLFASMKGGMTFVVHILKCQERKIVSSFYTNIPSTNILQ